jgi:hypothetical protein
VQRRENPARNGVVKMLGEDQVLQGEFASRNQVPDGRIVLSQEPGAME